MKKIIAIAIGSGITAFLWVYFSFAVGLSTVAGYLAWSSFFVAGGNKEGYLKALCANFSGILIGFFGSQLSVLLANSIESKLANAIGSGLGTTVICLNSKFKMLSLIPCSFIGWSALIASGMDVKLTAISMFCGSLCGLLSVKITDIALKLMDSNKQKEYKLDKSY